MQVDWDLDAPWTPERIAVARTVACWYLGEVGGAELSALMADGHQFWLPEDGVDVPVGERGAWLASWVAEGLARSRLYLLEPAAGELAIQAGADVRNRSLALVKPPAPYGLLVCPGGLGYTADGMPLIAAAWQPRPAGWAGWALSWFIDTRVWLDALLADGVIGADEPAKLIRRYGLLRYVHTVALHDVHGDTAQQLLDEGAQSIVSAATAQHLLDLRGAQTLVGGAEHDPGSAAHGASATLCGAWALIVGKAINLDRVPAPADVTARDHQVGIIPSRITRGWIETTDPDRVWDYGAGPVT